MGHAVYFVDVDGESRFEELPSLEAAVERVERLRNDQQVGEVRVFREIPIEVRTYYRVVAVAEPATEDALADTSDTGPVAEPTATSDPAAMPGPGVVPEPAATLEPPSGAMVMSRPPVAVGHDASSDGAEGDGPAEHRRTRFGRN